MGQTTARHFRDKLAMRIKAKGAGIPVPPFTALFHDEDINQFAGTVPAPWIVKPRAEASATGMKKVHNAQELWEAIHGLGDLRHQYLVEQFKPGAVYHSDAISVEGKVVFCRISQYLDTPFDVAHGGGIFRSATVEFGGKDDKALQKLTANVMKAFGMQYSASHTEFIKSADDGQFYFLETASRVGGANLAELVETSSGLNLWYEWSKLETAMANGTSYKLPETRKDYAGILISLTKYQHPDQSPFDAPEITWRLEKDYHIGLILRSKDRSRIISLLDEYAAKVFKDYHASAPVPKRPLD
jgi:biotin carboxylase